MWKYLEIRTFGKLTNNKNIFIQIVFGQCKYMLNTQAGKSKSFRFAIHFYGEIFNTQSVKI